MRRRGDTRAVNGPALRLRRITVTAPTVGIGDGSEDGDDKCEIYRNRIIASPKKCRNRYLITAPTFPFQPVLHLRILHPPFKKAPV